MSRKAAPSRNATPVMSTTASVPRAQASRSAAISACDVPASNSPESMTVVVSPNVMTLAAPRIASVSVRELLACVDMIIRVPRRSGQISNFTHKPPRYGHQVLEALPPGNQQHPLPPDGPQAERLPSPAMPPTPSVPRDLLTRHAAKFAYA